MDFEAYFVMDLVFNTGCTVGTVMAIFGVYQLAFNIFREEEAPYHVWGAFLWVFIGLWVWQFFRFF